MVTVRTFPSVCSFRGPDTAQLAVAVSGSGHLFDGPPASARDFNHTRRTIRDVREVVWQRKCSILWDDDARESPQRTVTGAFDATQLRRQLFFAQQQLDDAVKCHRIIAPSTPRSMLNAIADLPFYTFVGWHLYAEWTRFGSESRDKPDLYVPKAGFGHGHVELGWCAAFKGLGHAHLGSRRELRYNPWRILRDEAHDVTLVQFHDTQADAVTAAKQARPSHQLMGYTVLPVGVYFHGGTGMYAFPEPHPFTYDTSGEYDATTRTWRVRRSAPLFPREVTDFAAFRFYSRNTDQPIERFEVVFDREELARQHQEALWCREMDSCVEGGGRVAPLDADYVPEPPAPPDWVRAVQDREGE